MKNMKACDVYFHLISIIEQWLDKIIPQLKASKQKLENRLNCNTKYCTYFDDDYNCLTLVSTLSY